MRKGSPVLVGFVLLVLILLIVPGPSVVRAQKDQLTAVRAYLFYSETCPSCRAVRRDVLPAIYRQFGQQVTIKAIEITESEQNYRWLVACEEAYGVSEDEAAVPVLFIGDTYLIGPDIQAELSPLIQQHLDSGGVAYPDVPPPDGTPKPTARFMFFYSPTCPHCLNVETNVFPKIKAKYGEQVQWQTYDTSQEGSLRALLALGEMAGLPEEMRGSVPVIFVGDEYSRYRFLLGEDQIGAYLERALDWFLEVGGIDLPGWTDQLFEPAESPLTEPAPTSSPAPAQEIHLAYFVEVGCSECDRVANILQVVQGRFPNLVVREFDLIDDISYNLCLSERLDVPEDQRHDAPAIFVESDYLVDKAIQLDPLIKVLEEYAETGAAPTWELCTDEVAVPPPALWWAVIVPGLIDGINPCAFATIVFFVSYLSLIERKGRDIILVGLSFTLAIFLSYLGFGIVLRQVLAQVIDLVGPVLKPILNGVTAVVCVALAILSFGDFRKVRRGRTKDMALRLPDRLRRWINATIRKSMKAEALPRLITASFVAGVVVSFVELTCTGQVYAPIILGLSDPQYQGQAMLSLVVYCLAFVVPLIVVFVVSFMGTSSRQLGVFLQRHTATVKLLTAVVFLVIGAWLIYDVLYIWGIVGPLVT